LKKGKVKGLTPGIQGAKCRKALLIKWQKEGKGLLTGKRPKKKQSQEEFKVWDEKHDAVHKGRKSCPPSSREKKSRACRPSAKRERIIFKEGKQERLSFRKLGGICRYNRRLVRGFGSGRKSLGNQGGGKLVSDSCEEKENKKKGKTGS